MNENNQPIGKVTDYFWKRQIVRIEVLNGTIHDGDQLHIKGEFTDETIDIKDMEVDDESVTEATEGQIFAMPLGMDQRVTLGDEVYLIE